MIKVFAEEHGIRIDFIQNMLEDAGIPTLVKNRNLAGALGEIPPFECWPELWITNDADLLEARQIVDAAQGPASEDHSIWQCSCGEAIEGQFSACWNCGQDRRD